MILSKYNSSVYLNILVLCGGYSFGIKGVFPLEAETKVEKMY